MRECHIKYALFIAIWLESIGMVGYQHSNDTQKLSPLTWRRRIDISPYGDTQCGVAASILVVNVSTFVKKISDKICHACPAGYQERCIAFPIRSLNACATG